MKILALDLGDRWVGSAISDGLGISCKPYQTVELTEVEAFLQKVLMQENISTVIVGYPKTFSGGASEQTMKIEKSKNDLEKKFGEINNKKVTWLLWDERLSSKRATDVLKGSTSPEAKKKNHSIAAAFILQSYLDFQAFKREQE
jgi:putative Holliday junction resolvase